MRVVLVGGIVEVNDLRRAGRQNGSEIVTHGVRLDALHHGARMRQLDNCGVLAELRRLALLRAANGLHLLVRVIGKLP